MILTTNKKPIKVIFKIIEKMIIFLISFLLALTFLEIVLRISPANFPIGKPWQNSGYYTLDSNRIYRIKANQQTSKSAISDKDGFRFNPSHKKVGSNQQRIAMVGDSFTYGHGVLHHQTYPFFLEKKLNSLGYDIWVDNAGVPGYGPDQEFVYLKEEIIPKIRPDFIIWNLSLNDEFDSNEACLFRKHRDTYYQLSGRLNSLYFTQYYPPLLPKIIRESKLLSFLLSLFPERYTLGCTQNKKISGEEFAEKLNFLLNEVKVLLSSSNAQLLVTIIPDKHILSGAQEYEHRQNRKKILTATIQQADVPFFDFNTPVANFIFSCNQNGVNRVLGVAADNAASELFFEEKEFYSPHLNQLGNEVAAEVLSKEVEKLLN